MPLERFTTTRPTGAAQRSAMPGSIWPAVLDWALLLAAVVAVYLFIPLSA